MGVLNSIRNFFSRDKVTVSKVIDLLNQGYSPMEINRQIYDIPEIRTAINFVAEKCASVPLYHARVDSAGNVNNINSSINRVLTIRPNPYQTPQVFWTQAKTQKLLHNNCFIFVDWGINNDSGILHGLYILPFTQFEYAAVDDGKLAIRFPTGSGSWDFYYDSIIHLQRFPTSKGGAARHATGNYVEIVDTIQEQAVKDSKTSGRISALIQATNPLKGSHMKKRLDEFKELFLSSENTTGFGFIGAEYNVQKLDMNRVPLNTKLLDAITRSLYNYFGASHEIINGAATAIQNQQFIVNSVRPDIRQTTEELTYKLFSAYEIHHNNRILADTTELEISTLDDQTRFYKEMIFGGVMTRNEIRKRIGMSRGPDALDEFMQSKNFIALGQRPEKEPIPDDAKGGE